MKLYAGVDLSLTGTGVVVIDEDSKIFLAQLISTDSKMPIEKRITFISSTVKKMVWNASIINVEALAFGARGSSAFQLGGLHYYVRVALREVHENVFTTPPTKLKKWVCGKGSANKELMLLKCWQRFQEEFSDNNLCDAYCLARYGRDHFGSPTNKLVHRKGVRKRDA